MLLWKLTHVDYCQNGTGRTGTWRVGTTAQLGVLEDSEEIGQNSLGLLIGVVVGVHRVRRGVWETFVTIVGAEDAREMLLLLLGREEASRRGGRLVTSSPFFGRPRLRFFGPLSVEEETVLLSCKGGRDGAEASLL